MSGVLSIKTPNILFFQNIYPEKYDLDAMMTKRIMDELHQSETQYAETWSDDATESAFDTIPAKFTTIEAWPMHTNLACWYCRRTFKTRPIALVNAITNDGRRVAVDLDTYGNFCSADCIGSFLDLSVHDREARWAMEKKVCILFRKLTGRAITELPRAPLFTDLEQCGGAISINTFIKSLVGIVV